MTKLGELGLSSYEEQVYRALLSLGRAPAGDVADASDVPSGRIYDVLNGLATRDVVTARETDPRTYEAVPPEVAVDRLLADRQQELDARAERYESLASEVSADLAATMPAESRFFEAPLGSEAGRTLVSELYDRADHEILSAMSVPYGRAAWDRYAEEMALFAEHVEDDLTVRTLVTPRVLAAVPDGARESLSAALSAPPVRVSSDLTVSVDVVDGSTVCFHVPHPVDPSERLGIIEVEDASLAASLESILAEAWAVATPLADALDGQFGADAAGDSGSSV